MTRLSRLQEVTVLLSSIGRRSQLVGCFRDAFRELGVGGRLIGIDADPENAPAAHLLDRCYRVPKCGDPTFVNRVLNIGIEEGVCLIVPTIDPELRVYAATRQLFQDAGLTVMVSDPQTIKIACDKEETHRWLLANGFPTVRQGTPDEVLANASQWKFPLILKPRCGSASVGVTRINSLSALKALTEHESDCIVQECAQGAEHTINVFVENGRCVCAVPHRRIETRGGEVSKGVTSKNGNIMKLATEIAERLPGARGALNIQCFVHTEEAINVIEVNARFGGGFPLANRAGAKFPRWMLESVLERQSTATSKWEDGLLMLRYDSAAFIHGVGGV